MVNEITHDVQKFKLPIYPPVFPIKASNVYFFDETISL